MDSNDSDSSDSVRALEPPPGTPPLYAQDGQGFGATVYAHLFVGTSDWLVTEYDPDERRAFGWACLGGDRQNAELGYVSLEELAGLRVPLLLQSGERQVRIGDSIVERDADWPAGLTLNDAVELIDRRQGR